LWKIKRETLALFFGLIAHGFAMRKGKSLLREMRRNRKKVNSFGDLGICV